MASVVIAGDTSGTVTLAAPAVAGTTTLTLPTANGTVLTTASTGISASNITTGTLPKAQLPSGTVLQVVQSTKTDTQSFSGLSTSWADITGLSVTITPTSSASRFLILGGVMTSITSNTVQLKLQRNGSDIFVADAAGSRKRGMVQLYPSAGPVVSVYSTASFVDSPATSSAVTYKFQLSIGGGATDYVNRCARDQDNAVEDGRGASSIIVMEIAG